MQLAIELIKTKFPECIQMGLSIVPGNKNAADLYTKLGFVDTGVDYEGEIEWILKVERQEKI